MSNMNFDEPNKKNFLSGKGFYIAMAICLVAIGVAAWNTYNNVMDYVNPDTVGITEGNSYKETDNKTKEQEANNTINSIKKESNENEITPYTEEELDKAKETATDKIENLDTVVTYPTNKEILKEFSNVNPLYSKTLNDWRVHNGIDFKAEQGSKVKSITGGVVKEIYEDPMFGMTMVIEHTNDITAYYSGLGNTTLVKAGDKVDAGQEIGSINDIPSEISDGPHLHLGIQKSDKWIDPLSILESNNE